jgi:dTDP-4-amino-4,6-dideoxygalactose transaminase
LESEALLLEVIENLKQHNISGRRYFYPSLNELPYLAHQSCPVSEDLSRRVLCLPLYVGLKKDEIKIILDCITKIIIPC